jgi:glycosyltransferase 2 family protein
LLSLLLGDWIFVLGTLELCFMALGLVTPFTILTSGFIVGKTAAILSFIPGGIGVQDTSTAGIYSLLGISFNIAILVAVLFRVVYHYIPYIVSLPLFRSLLKAAYKNK